MAAAGPAQLYLLNERKRARAIRGLSERAQAGRKQKCCVKIYIIVFPGEAAVRALPREKGVRREKLFLFRIYFDDNTDDDMMIMMIMAK